MNYIKEFPWIEDKPWGLYAFIIARQNGVFDGNPKEANKVDMLMDRYTANKRNMPGGKRNPLARLIEAFKKAMLKRKWGYKKRARNNCLFSV